MTSSQVVLTVLLGVFPVCTAERLSPSNPRLRLGGRLPKSTVILRIPVHRQGGREISARTMCNRSVSNGVVAHFSLAFMTGALRAKRGERDISRGARHEHEARGEEENFIFVFPSSRAPRKISRSPRLAHKAPVMQVNFSQTCIPYWLAHTLHNGNIFSSTSYPYASTMSVKARADQTWNIFVSEFYISISAVQTSLLQVKGKFTSEGYIT